MTHSPQEMTLRFFKALVLRKVIGLLCPLHRGFNNDDPSSINYLWSGRIAGHAHEHCPTRMHANTERCVFHSRLQNLAAAVSILAVELVLTKEGGVHSDTEQDCL